MTTKQLKRLRTHPIPAAGNRLAVAFEIDGRSQMECVRQTGFTPQYVTDVKAGRHRNLTLDNLYRFANFFGCAIEDLFPAREAVAS